MSPRARLAAATFAGCALVAATAAHAQRVPVVNGDATIESGAGVSTNGVVTVNEAAGLNNAQANQMTITQGGTAAGSDNASVQSASARAKVPSAHATIEGNAFSNSSGALMINQAAGAANLQRNSVQIGTGVPGVETVTDGELSATAPKNGGQDLVGGVRSVREANISSDAFKNVSGIVQINQTAGAGNTTANSFVLRPPAGTLF
ncbi:hypothetical protein [Paraburkholderia phosphatilytica]|uniref:hypothetical protein n=1 Tax=Paraburkholderia phosphatilytica TaxID=2282883 RepID=UPI000E4A89A4|nr:hypothetical protein [Paraburkholderia phosphatilytica]